MGLVLEKTAPTVTDDLVTLMASVNEEHMKLFPVGSFLLFKEAAARIVELESQLYVQDGIMQCLSDDNENLRAQMKAALENERKEIAGWMRKQSELLIPSHRDCLLINADVIEENRFTRATP